MNVPHGGDRPGAGRKPLYGKALSERVMLKTMPGERDAWKRKAKRLGKPLNTWARDILNHDAQSK